MNRRRGYTLVEIVAVLAIMAIVCAIAVPLIKPMMSDRNLQAAEDLVKQRWSKMRSNAQDKGQTYKFGYKEDSGKFRIAPDSDEYWGEDEQPDDAVLPGEIKFKTGSSAGSSGSWTMLQTCFADGSVSNNDVTISLEKTGSPTITLKMRGATGAVSSEGNPQ
jgi:prepilin-type N-terminal cleavage/methylation domain-containing protein